MKKLKNLFIPNRENNYCPRFFESSVVVAFSAFVIIAFVFSVNIPNILRRVTLNSQLSAVLPAVLIDLTNVEREKSTLSPLSENELLNKAATLKATDMAKKGYFAHSSPDGKKPWHWLQEVEYEYQYAGENLAVNYQDSEEVALAWMNSPTHRANIIKAEYTEIGVGVATGTYSGSESVFVAQVFAKPYVPDKTASVMDATNPVKNSADNFFSYLLYDNYDLTNKILIGFLILVSIALILNLFINIKVQHKRIILTGLGVFGFIVALLLVNNYIHKRTIYRKQAHIEYSSFEYHSNENNENFIKTQ